MQCLCEIAVSPLHKIAADRRIYFAGVSLICDWLAQTLMVSTMTAHLFHNNAGEVSFQFMKL